MTKRRTSPKRRSSFGLILPSALIIIVIASMGAFARYISSVPTIVPDTETGCIPDRKPTAHTVLLVDRTDTFSARHKEDIARILPDLWSDMVVGEELSIIFILGRQPPSVPEVWKIRCKGPANTAEMQSLGISTSATDGWLAEQASDFNKTKVAPLTTDILADTEASADSEIMEYISQIALWSDFRTGARKLIIISDFLENSRNFAISGNANITFDKFRQSPFGSRALDDQATLKGADVSLWYVSRNEYSIPPRPSSASTRSSGLLANATAPLSLAPPLPDVPPSRPAPPAPLVASHYYQTPRHKLFWRQYFEAITDRSVRFTELADCKINSGSKAQC